MNKILSLKNYSYFLKSVNILNLLKLSPFIVGLLAFLLQRAMIVSVYFSDTNVYFYISYLILHGKRLYTEIPFYDMPLFPYITTFYFWLSHGSIMFFYFTGALEASITSIIIFLIIFQLSKSYSNATFGALFYIFSFFVLQLSVHQQGIFTGSMLILLSYLLLLKKHYFFSGILLSASVIVKLYFLPIALVFFLYLLLSKNWKQFLHLIAGFTTASLVILTPFIIYAHQQMFNDIQVNLSRSEEVTGISRLQTLNIFLIHDFSFVILFIFCILNFRKNLFFALICIASFTSFFVFKDFRYLYLNTLVPFLCISLYEFNGFIEKHLSFLFPKISIPILLTLIMIYNFYMFYTLVDSTNFARVTDIDAMTSLIKQEKPAFIYGTNQLTPALAYLTKTPMLEGIVDTNEQFFSVNILSKTFLTQKAIEKKALVISYGIYYPIEGIEQDFSTLILDENLFSKSCVMIHSYPIVQAGTINTLNFFRCGQSTQH